MNFKVTAYGALLLVGALVALISIFLNWIDIGTEAWTGWEIFSDRFENYYVVPIVLFVLAMMVIGAAIDEFIGRFDSIRTVLRAIVLIIGVVIILLSLILASNGFSVPGWMGDVAIGFYMAVAAGALITVSAILSLPKVLQSAE